MRERFNKMPSRSLARRVYGPPGQQAPREGDRPSESQMATMRRAITNVPAHIAEKYRDEIESPALTKTRAISLVGELLDSQLATKKQLAYVNRMRVSVGEKKLDYLLESSAQAEITRLEAEVWWVK